METLHKRALAEKFRATVREREAARQIMKDQLEYGLELQRQAERYCDKAWGHETPLECDRCGLFNVEPPNEDV